MKRILALVALAAVGALLLVVVNATAGEKPKGDRDHGTIHVIEHATSDAVTNGSATTDQAGNVLTFANDVFDSADRKKVGTDQGYCIRIVVGQSWECNWTTFLSGGQITFEGPFSDTGNTVLAITGGTGSYRNARGVMELIYHNPAGTEFDFVFHLQGDDD
jgi:allene oxide cyclase-like protein